MHFQQIKVHDEYVRQLYIKTFGVPPPPPPEPLTDEERRDRRKAAGYRSQAARRARLLNAKVIEKIDRYAIWDRDHGICHICTQPADRSHFHLDHVKALALGGDHSHDNLKVAHPACNIRKGASPWPT
jgi:5-methylcytosine-specific restriction endonuclease McrA